MDGGSWNLSVFVSARQKVIWLGVSGLALNLMSWACKGYTSTSEIEIIDSNVEQNVNYEKHQNIKVGYPFMPRFTVPLWRKNGIFHFLTFQWTESSGEVIFLMLEWHKHLDYFCLWILWKRIP